MAEPSQTSTLPLHRRHALPWEREARPQLVKSSSLRVIVSVPSPLLTTLVIPL